MRLTDISCKFPLRSGAATELISLFSRMTKSTLEIDFFNFDWWIVVMNEFKPSREMCIIKDVSYGKENVAISCVNSIDRNFPEYVEYSTVRLPQPGVNLNTDPEFLAGCSPSPSSLS